VANRQVGRETPAQLERGGCAVAQGTVAQGDDRDGQDSFPVARSAPGRQEPRFHHAQPDRPDNGWEARGRGEQCDGKSCSGSCARRSQEVRKRMGMAGSSAKHPDAERAHKANSVPDAGRGAEASSSVAGASCGHGGVFPGNRFASGERNRSAMDTSGFGASYWLGASRSGEGSEGDCGAA